MQSREVVSFHKHGQHSVAKTIKDVNSLHFSQAIAPWRFISHNFPCQQKHTKTYTPQSCMCFHASPEFPNIQEILLRSYAEMLLSVSRIATSAYICATFKYELLERKWKKHGPFSRTTGETHSEYTEYTTIPKASKACVALGVHTVFAVQGFRAAIFGIATGEPHASQGSLDILICSVHGIISISRHLIWKRHQLTNHELRMADLRWGGNG